MNTLSTEFLEKCIRTLEVSFEHLLLAEDEKDDIGYEMYRNSFVKGFEMTLEQSGKLLRKKLVPYFANKKAADQLMFKDIFRHASKHGLLEEDVVRRWLAYRDNRNNTSHDYGQIFAEQTADLARELISDAKALVEVINHA